MKERDQDEMIASFEGELGRQITLPEGSRLEEAITDDGNRVILYEGAILFFQSNGMMIPSLRALLDDIVTLPEVTVDMGAVRFVANGADIMRPGITAVDDEVREGSLVAIVDERHGKALAVGIATMDAEGIRSVKKGKVIRSKHHVGDELWEFGKD
ncbi:RNA-binding protein [Candidatus Thorarchaeota archaeon]|nr:MAG: RNA-binding protein [Candidatus Thorarchaeota archaeon]